MLAIGGFWLNRIQKSRDEKAAQQRAKTEHEIATDNQRETALQAYIDKMSELLLEKNLQSHHQKMRYGRRNHARWVNTSLELLYGLLRHPYRLLEQKPAHNEHLFISSCTLHDQ